MENSLTNLKIRDMLGKINNIEKSSDLSKCKYGSKDEAHMSKMKPIYKSIQSIKLTHQRVWITQDSIQSRPDRTSLQLSIKPVCLSVHPIRTYGFFLEDSGQREGVQSRPDLIHDLHSSRAHGKSRADQNRVY